MGVQLSYKCNFCGLYFCGLPAFYRHRVGTGSARRCLNEMQMFNAGLRAGTDYSATKSVSGHAMDASQGVSSNTDGRITHGRPRRRMECAVKEPIAKSAARWCFDRGLNPDDMVKAGLPQQTVVDVVEARLKELKGSTAVRNPHALQRPPKVEISNKAFQEQCRLAHRLRMLGDSWEEVMSRLGVSNELAHKMATAGCKSPKSQVAHIAKEGLVNLYLQEKSAVPVQ